MVTAPIELVVMPGTAAGGRLPWWGKMAAKFVLRRAVPHYAWRRRLGIGVHSFTAASLGHRLEITREIAWFTATTGRPPTSLLELGPGDSIANALYAAALGVRRIWLMDDGDNASADMAAYRSIAATLPALPPLDFSSRLTLLTSLGAVYLTGGTASLADIPAGSVDISVSYTVLEHVRRAEFSPLLAELHRVTAPGGLGHHFVDLMDHIGGGLNNLRFSSSFWERDAIARSGFYTNRLSCRAIIAAAEAAGFAVRVPYLSRWPSLPVARAALSREFSEIADEDLNIASFALELRR